jgi:hypothetical protein
LETAHETQELFSDPASAFNTSRSFCNTEFGYWRNNDFSGHTVREPFA